MMEDLLQFLLALNKVSYEKDTVTYQVRSLSHYDIYKKGITTDFEVRVFRQKPRANLETIQTGNLAQTKAYLKKTYDFWSRR